MEEKAKVFFVPDKEAPLEIALDPKLTPSENAQKYFRRYKKLKRRASTGLVRLHEMEEDERFLGRFGVRISKRRMRPGTSPVWKKRWRGRVTPGGGERKKRRKDARTKGRQPARARPYRRFVSPAGWEVIVGKNAMGNDEMLKSVGRASDTWLHARGVPGSHVLLRRADGEPTDPGEEILAQAAAFRGVFQPGANGFQAHRRLPPLLSLKEAERAASRTGADRQPRDDPRRSGRMGRRLCAEWEEVS